MAIRYAVQNGNWNDPATWDGGTSVPGTDDVVVANGYTVTINVSPITVQRLSTIAEGDAPNNGGQFVLGVDNQVVNASEITGVVLNSTSINNPTLNGNVVGGYTVGFHITAANRTVYINGNVTGNSSHGIRLAGNINATINVTGNISGSTINANVHGIASDYGGNNGHSIFCTGTIKGEVGCGVFLEQYPSASSITANTIEGGTGSSSHGIRLRYISQGAISITTNSIVGNSGNGIFSDSSGSAYYSMTITINGDITSYSAPAINFATSGSSETCIVTVNGDVKCLGSASTVIFPNNRYQLRILSNLIFSSITGSSDGVNPISGGRVKFRNRDTTYTDYAEMDSSWNATGNYVRQYGSALALQGFPDTGDVRQGTQYGPTNEYTGTCAVPVPDAVLVGVPIDDTVGTAVINTNTIRNAMWNALLEDYKNAGTFGEAINNLLSVGIFGECSGTSSDSEISTTGISSGVINSYLVFISGSLAGLSRRIVNVTGGTIIYVSPAFPQAPNSGDKFVILGRAG